MAEYQQNRFAPPRAEVQDTPGQGEMVTATRGSRLAAVFIDMAPSLCIGIAAAILLPAYEAIRRATGGEPGHYGGLIVGGAIAVLALLAYIGYSISLVYRFGQTFGKKVMGIRVVRTDGSRVAFARFVFLRWLPLGLLGAIPYIGWIVGLTDSLLIFRDSSRCLHDDIADTLVVTAASSPDATLAGSRVELPTISF
jgi:uncharacterized RDD family membrane protein YckC